MVLPRVLQEIQVRLGMKVREDRSDRWVRQAHLQVIPWERLGPRERRVPIRSSCWGFKGTRVYPELWDMMDPQESRALGVRKETRACLGFLDQPDF